MPVVDHYPAYVLWPLPMCAFCAFPWPPRLCLINLPLFIFVSRAILPSLSFFCEFECFAQLAAPRPIQLVLCHAVPFFLMLAFQMSQTISSEAVDVVLLACELWASSPLADIKQEQCHCVLFSLSVGWFRSASLSAFLSVSFCFHGDVPCVQFSCVQYTTPPLRSFPPCCLL